MSNGERGRKLLAASREHLAEMEGALHRHSWNIAVRRAQEVVELALKAVLTYLCIDYPKVHDAADLFVATLAARQMVLSEVEAADVVAERSERQLTLRRVRRIHYVELYTCKR